MVKSSCSLNIELIPVPRLITTTEVNMARIYNWDVIRRQRLKQEIKSRERGLFKKIVFIKSIYSYYPYLNIW